MIVAQQNSMNLRNIETDLSAIPPNAILIVIMCCRRIGWLSGLIEERRFGEQIGQYMVAKKSNCDTCNSGIIHHRV